jgi:hypothetical protein
MKRITLILLLICFSHAAFAQLVLPEPFKYPLSLYTQNGILTRLGLTRGGNSGFPPFPHDSTVFLRGDSTWHATGGGGMAIGGAVTGGTTASVLYVDGSGNLAQNAGHFNYDGSTQVTVLNSSGSSGFSAWHAGVTNSHFTDYYLDFRDISSGRIFTLFPPQSGNSWSFTFPADSGGSGRALTTNGANPAVTYWATNANSQSTPSNPTGTTSTTPVMAGLAATITPTNSGKVLIIVSGILRNNTATDGINVQMAYGTGAAPANGDAATGTTTGNLLHGLNEPDFNYYPFSVQSVVTGLTVSTAYWIDLQFNAITAGTATVQDISVSIVELP